MIVVDTSVWIAALRRSASEEARALSGLLDADEVALPVAVRLELLSGASNADRPSLRRALSALPILYPTDETWSVIDRWVERAHRSGWHFGVGDLLIGAMAHEAGALLWSLDADFERLARLKLIQLYATSIAR
ncbi:MAG TPA: PIN domain-containing protein [Vicinamibacterales bacterium]|nr:PIN domain-containing protein [Vicinamibacterales bacterium]